jgi:flavin-dependent dehydrogenase
MDNNFDCLIVGGGIVGLATALNILESKPELHVAVMEKEDRVAKHQTGNNSDNPQNTEKNNKSETNKFIDEEYERNSRESAYYIYKHADDKYTISCDKVKFTASFRKIKKTSILFYS